MLKINFRREKKEEFRHIAHGLIPAASVAPKPAVPRTPPPRNPNPLAERPRSALAAAIFSSSLTGQTWAIPPVRPRSYSDNDQSESMVSGPNFNTTHYMSSTSSALRDRWSEDLADRPRLSSPEHSDEEFMEEEDEDDEDHVYQSLERHANMKESENVPEEPLESLSGTPLPAQMSGREAASPDFTRGSGSRSPGATGERASVKRSPENWKEDVSSLPPIPAASPSSCSRGAGSTSPELSKIYSKVQKPRKPRRAGEHQQHQERHQRLEQETRLRHNSSHPGSSAGSKAELQSLRRHAQELVDENDALKLTVHRLNSELSRYQAHSRPPSKEEVDMKRFHSSLLAYEDRMKEKDELLRNTEEEVKKLRLRVEELMKEKEKLSGESGSMSGYSQKDSQQIHQQALLVLQENQDLLDQIEAQHVEAKANQSKHQSEVTRLSKQLMLLEAEKQRLEEELQESRREAQKQAKEVQALQKCLKDAVTWDEHCHIAGKLRRQLEQQESRNKEELEELFQRVSSLQEEKRRLAQDNLSLTADVKTMRAELDLCRQANRKAERKMSVLKKQKDESLLKEEKIRLHLEALMSVAEHISKQRDQLLHTAFWDKIRVLQNKSMMAEVALQRGIHILASTLHQEKQGFMDSILNTTLRFGKLQEETKVKGSTGGKTEAEDRLANEKVKF
ncbi:centrosomal protein of 89 kDa isoform X4 [Oryzias melastigma]|uniref:centrosomal protein of 89 kDa isoform X4 n=1 Tax=Oryzias melastigma TaxID=30732 RepID=UPI000CF7C774|nr:centrosomal protein of 89 kDa isoform X4 [Oryzias melastigma]